MGAEHEVVAAVLVAEAGVVLHRLADERTLGVPHGEAGPEFFGPRHQVEVVSEAAVVALDRLLQTVQVGGEVLLVRPRRSVDALQHRVLLGAPEVRAGHPHELEVAETTGGRHVRAATHVHEGRRVAIEADPLPRRHLAVGIVARRRQVHELLLVGMRSHQLLGFGDRQLEALEGLVGRDDLAHAGIDRGEVVLGERGPLGKLEVVVEAVVDGGATGERGTRPHLEDSLREHVGGRVPEVFEGLGIAVGHELHGGVVWQGRRQVVGLTVDIDDERCLGQARTDRLGQGGAGRALGEAAFGTVWERDRDVGHGEHATGAPSSPRAVCPTPETSW